MTGHPHRPLPTDLVYVRTSPWERARAWLAVRSSAAASVVVGSMLALGASMVALVPVAAGLLAGVEGDIVKVWCFGLGITLIAVAAATPVGVIIAIVGAWLVERVPRLHRSIERRLSGGGDR